MLIVRFAVVALNTFGVEFSSRGGFTFGELTCQENNSLDDF